MFIAPGEGSKAAATRGKRKLFLNILARSAASLSELIGFNERQTNKTVYQNDSLASLKQIFASLRLCVFALKSNHIKYRPHLNKFSKKNNLPCN